MINDDRLQQFLLEIEIHLYIILRIKDRRLSHIN
jgi:hypothetical protein